MNSVTVEQILRDIQICIPFQRLIREYLPLFLKKRINPEIGVDGQTMDTLSKKDFKAVATVLRNEGLTVTLHGPFYDLAPGAIDKKILLTTRERLKQTFDLIPIFEPRSIVCHTGYDQKRYRDTEREWLDTSVETWTALLSQIEGTGTTLVIENVYEKTPRILGELLQALQDRNVGLCLDMGHAHAFSETSIKDWLEKTGYWVRQVHLHDNTGEWDDHMAVGEGNIDFDLLFDDLLDLPQRPILTLEAHEEASLWQSLAALSRSTSFRRLLSLEASR